MRIELESIRRKCFAGLAKIKRWSQVLPVKAKNAEEGAVQRTSATLFGLLFCSVTGVF